MRLPWVSQARYALLEHNTREMVAQLKTALAIADARAAAVDAQYADLLEKYHGLKLAGAVNAPPTTTAGAVLPTEPAELRDLKALIHDVCASDYAKRAMMLRQLGADIASGMSPDAIRDAILTGVQSDGVPA